VTCAISWGRCSLIVMSVVVYLAQDRDQGVGCSERGSEPSGIV